MAEKQKEKDKIFERKEGNRKKERKERKERKKEKKEAKMHAIHNLKKEGEKK